MFWGIWGQKCITVTMGIQFRCRPWGLSVVKVSKLSQLLEKWGTFWGTTLWASRIRGQKWSQKKCRYHGYPIQVKNQGQGNANGF